MNATNNTPVIDWKLTPLAGEIKNLNECAKRYTERNVSYYGTGRIYPTAVLEAIAKYGAENIIEYVDDYHGKY